MDGMCKERVHVSWKSTRESGRRYIYIYVYVRHGGISSQNVFRTSSTDMSLNIVELDGLIHQQFCNFLTYNRLEIVGAT